MNVVEAKTPTPDGNNSIKQNPGVVWHHSGSNSGIHYRPCTDIFGFVAGDIYFFKELKPLKLYKF